MEGKKIHFPPLIFRVACSNQSFEDCNSDTNSRLNFGNKKMDEGVIKSFGFTPPDSALFYRFLEGRRGPAKALSFRSTVSMKSSRKCQGKNLRWKRSLNIWDSFDCPFSPSKYNKEYSLRSIKCSPWSDLTFHPRSNFLRLGGDTECVWCELLPVSIALIKTVSNRLISQSFDLVRS